MTNLDYKEKLLGVIRKDEDHKIIVTHITIRQSIFFLVLRLLTIEAIATTAVIVFHTLLFTPQISDRIGSNIALFNIPVFILLVLIKTSFVIFVIAQWLNEYYEITAKEVIYRRGLILRREEQHKLAHIGSVRLEQGFLGRIFNYGTLKLFNWTIERDVVMYLIHNPRKYQNILDELIPEADKSKKVFREHILEPEDDSL
ncbi:MAG: PH domain-containing protein [Candidatus Levybacteria bacterium]|nr:PH domain-containing protein [Candidatus Levybacteria bacterium]